MFYAEYPKHYLCYHLTYIKYMSIILIMALLSREQKFDYILC